MKVQSIYKTIVLFILAGVTFICKGQQGVAINIAGNTNYTGAILDLSNLNTNGALGFLPTYANLTSATILNPPIVGGIGGQLSGLMVYNTSASLANGLSGPGLYYWDNALATPSWIYLGGSGTVGGAGTTNYIARWLNANTLGTGVAQDNGTSMGISAAAIAPQSLLDVKGNISVGTYAGVNAAPANGIIISGQSSIGNNAPDSKAILDLTNNTNHYGMMLPSMTTAQLPVIGPAQNGLMVYNTTLGCPEYAYNGVWYPMP